jgi:hypothetical protein
MRKMIAAMVLALASAHAVGSFGLTLASAAAPQSTTTPAPTPTQPPAATTDPVAPSNPQSPLERHCTTLGGKSFKWSFPNVPFGAARCS